MSDFPAMHRSLVVDAWGVQSRRDWLRRTAAALGCAVLWPGGASALAADASRGPLLVHEESPFNAETRLEELIRHWVTPTESFYVRSNGPVPQVDLDAYRLTVDGLVEKPLFLALGELRERFTPCEVTATLCCAGNRRSEFSRIKPVKGLPWEGGAIGNAKWGGVKLADVLRAAGATGAARHVCFEGLDRHEKGGREIVFGGSILLERVLAGDPAGEVLIATQMNGAPLTGDHGAPARIVVPGFIGARSVKWVSRITLSAEPSENYYVARAYKLVTEDTPEAWAQAAILYELPLQAVICTARMVQRKKREQLEVQGYALPPGNRGGKAARVEVSADGGRTWTAATLQGQPQPYCWQFWTATLRQRKPAERVLVRAIDADWRMQPETPAWNLQGYLYNGWHGAAVEAAIAP